MIVKTLVHSATVIAMGAILWPLSVAALEPLAVYEDWTQALIRPDRWRGGENATPQEVKRVVTPDHALLLRLRREGLTASDTGSTAAGQFLNTANPTQVTEIKAAFTVSNLSMIVCAVNNAGLATRARPAQLVMAKFNDGTQSTPGDRTGDYFAGVEARRDGSSADPDGVLKVQGFIDRCTDAPCSPFPIATTVIAKTLATTVSVGQSFTLRLQWDQPNHQFLFGLDDAADVTLPYAASDTAPAQVPFVQVAVFHATANCTAGAVAIDSAAQVGTVQTNSSAVIP